MGAQQIPDMIWYDMTQFFSGRMPFLPPNQQRQSIEGESTEGDTWDVARIFKGGRLSLHVAPILTPRMCRACYFRDLYPFIWFN